MLHSLSRSPATTLSKPRQAKSRGEGDGGGLAALGATWWRSIAILMRSPLFKKLTVVMMVSGVVSEGLQDLLMQYLQLKLDFTTSDQVGESRSRRFFLFTVAMLGVLFMTSEEDGTRRPQEHVAVCLRGEVFFGGGALGLGQF